MRQQQNNMEVIVNFSIPERTKKMPISVENDLGISSEEWERLDEDGRLELLNDFAGEFDPEYWSADTILTEQ